MNLANLQLLRFWYAENASSKKSKSENFITKFARVYTPAVCYGAIALAVPPPLFSMLFLHISPEWVDSGFNVHWPSWLSVVLVLWLLVFRLAFAGIGGASMKVFWLKAPTIWKLAQTKYVVFDKTGTLTEGVFEVTEFITWLKGERSRLGNMQLLSWELFLTHPISKSLQKCLWKGNW